MTRTSPITAIRAKAPARAYRQIRGFVRREHSSWLVALGALFTLLDRRYAIWLSAAMVALFAIFHYLNLRLRPGSRWLLWLSRFEAFSFGCISTVIVRLLVEYAVELIRMPNRPRTALWVGAVVLVGGWGAATIKRLWLFGYGVVEIAWGVVLGISSQTLVKTGQGGLELIALVSSVYLAARGFGTCSDANAIARREGPF
jgi:hypothetical protein